MTDMTVLEAHRTLLDSITDDMLTKPARDLTVFESDVLQAVFRGPLGNELIQRVDNINND